MMLEEHTQCTPETLSCMEHDITKTISKYLPVSGKKHLSVSEAKCR